MPFRALDPTTAQAAPVITSGAPLVSVGETLSSMRSELLLELGSRADVDTTRLNKWINWGYRNLCGMLKLQELKFSFSINLIVGQPFYALPVQVRSVRNVSVEDATRYPTTGGVNLLMSNEEEYKRQPNNAAVKPYLSPQNWFRYGRMLVVFPDPVYVLPIDIDAWLRPDKLVLDADSPVIPEEFHEPLILHARRRAWRSLQEFSKANIAANDFLEALRPLIDTDGEEEENNPRGLTVVRKASDLTSVRR